MILTLSVRSPGSLSSSSDYGCGIQVQTRRPWTFLEGHSYLLESMIPATNSDLPTGELAPQHR
jgi:hypothetical protein